MESVPQARRKYPELITARSIRLLKVKPELQDEAQTSIYLDVETADLDESPEFKALSYTWGNPFPKSANFSPSEEVESPASEHVYCNGNEVPVTSNLYRALLRLRLIFPGRAFWVDGICINQKDMTERNSQVSLIGEIYDSARDVVVWLGEEDEDSRNACKLIDRLGPFAERMFREGRHEELNSSPFNDPSFYDKYEMQIIGLDWWKSFVRFNKRTWFQRAWVVQEIALANGLEMLCGDSEVHWENLYYVTVLMTSYGWGAILTALEHKEGASVGLYPGGLLRQMLNLQNELHHGRQRSLVEERLRRKHNTASQDELMYGYFQYILSIMRNFDSSEPHDKVYAALGLVKKFDPERQIDLPQPDYSLSTWEVYYATARTIIERLDSLMILSYVKSGTAQQIPNLPSWVPDFNEPLYQRFVDMGHGPDFNTSLQATSHDESRYFRGSILCLQAALCSSITETSKRLDNTNTLDALLSCLEIGSQLNITYRNGQSCFEALWRTIIANQDDGRVPAPEDFESRFRQLLLYRGSELLTYSKPENPQDALEKAWASISSFERSHPGCNLPTINDVQQLASRLANRRNQEEVMQFEAAINPFMQSYFGVAPNRKLFKTSDGLIGLCPESAQLGDQVAIVQGAKVPFVLRPALGENEMRLV